MFRALSCVVTGESLLRSVEDETPRASSCPWVTVGAAVGEPKKASWGRGRCEYSCPFSVLTRSYWRGPCGSCLVWEVPVCVPALKEVCLGQHTHPHFHFPLEEGSVSLRLGLLKPPGDLRTNFSPQVRRGFAGVREPPGLWGDAFSGPRAVSC